MVIRKLATNDRLITMVHSYVFLISKRRVGQPRIQVSSPQSIFQMSVAYPIPHIRSATHSGWCSYLYGGYRNAYYKRVSAGWLNRGQPRYQIGEAACWGYRNI